MVSISIEADVKDVTRMLTRLQKKQLPFATMQAMNQTAYEARQKTVKLISRVFDNPTPWVLKSTFYTKATKQNLVATVEIRDFGGKGIAGTTILNPHIDGGRRKMKRSERRFGSYLYPGRNTKRNKYGNITAGRISKALADTKNMFDPKQNTKNKKARYFSIRSGGRIIIMERVNKKTVVPFLVSGRAPTYKKRLRFFEFVQKQVDKRFNTNFNRHLRRALATAR